MTCDREGGLKQHVSQGAPSPHDHATDTHCAAVMGHGRKAGHRGRLAGRHAAEFRYLGQQHGRGDGPDRGNGAEQIRLGCKDLFLGEDAGDQLLKLTDLGLWS